MNHDTKGEEKCDRSFIFSRTHWFYSFTINWVFIHGFRKHPYIFCTTYPAQGCRGAWRQSQGKWGTRQEHPRRGATPSQGTIAHTFNTLSHTMDIFRDAYHYSIVLKFPIHFLMFYQQLNLYCSCNYIPHSKQLCFPNVHKTNNECTEFKDCLFDLKIYFYSKIWNLKLTLSWSCLQNGTDNISGA